MRGDDRPRRAWRIIVHDEGVLAVLYEPFSDGTARVGARYWLAGLSAAGAETSSRWLRFPGAP